MKSEKTFSSIFYSEVLEAKAITRFSNNKYTTSADNYFKGKRVVVTGVFSMFDRRTILSQLYKNGALLEINVSSQTDFLIIGNGFTEKKVEQAIQNKTTKLLYEKDILFFYSLDSSRKLYYEDLVNYHSEKAKNHVNRMTKLLQSSNH